MKQIVIYSLFCLGLFILICITFSSKGRYKEGFLDDYVDINYNPPVTTLNDQQRTYVNVNILKNAMVVMNDQITSLQSKVSDLQSQVTTLTNQQSDMVSNSTPDVEGTEM
jgi:hypothetical protein